MNVTIRIFLVAVLFGLLQSPLQCEEKKSTWVDIALSLNRFREAYQANPVPDDKLAAFSRSVDKALPRFISGKSTAIIKKLDSLTASLDRAADSAGARRAASLKVRVVPRAHVVGSEAAPVVAISSLYATDAPDTVRLTLRITLPDGSKSIEVPFEAAGGKDLDFSLSIPIDGIELLSGECPVEIVTAEGYAVFRTSWYLVSKPLAATREANEKLLDKVETGTEIMKQALGACKSRNNLLHDEPSERSLNGFMTDPVKLARELDEEIACLEKGLNPFKLRKGEYWRTISVGDDLTVPVRVYAPPSIDKNEPLPLLLVYYGPVFAPDMNIEAFGAGKLAKLADEKGFIVAGPNYPRFIPMEKKQSSSIMDDLFDTLVEVLSAEYPIATDRIYTLGHATAGPTAVAVGQSNPDQVAAICCISSTTPGFNNMKRFPYTLLMTGSEDLFADPHRVENLARHSSKRGVPIEYRGVDKHGRVMAAGQGLAVAVDWLLEQKMADGNEE